MKKSFFLIFLCHVLIFLLLFVAYTLGFEDNTFISILIIVVFLVNIWWFFLALVQLPHNYNSPEFFLILALLFWYSYPMLVNYFSGGFCYFARAANCNNPSNIILTMLFVQLFTIAIYLLGRTHTYNEQHSRIIDSEQGKNRGHFIIWFAVSLFLYHTILDGGLSSMLQKILISRSAGYDSGNLGDKDSFSAVVFSSFWVASIMLSIFFIYKNWCNLSKIFKVFTVFFLTVSVLYFTLSSGNRSQLMIFILPLLGLYWIKNRSYKTASKLLLCIFLIFSFTKLQLHSRNSGFEQSLSSSEELFDFSSMRVGQSSDFFSESLNAISYFDRSILDIKESETFIFITYPLPRFIFPWKPIPQAVSDYTLFRWGKNIMYSAGNVFPGIVGQLYYNGFIFGLLEFFLIVSFMIFINRFLILRLKLDDNDSAYLSLFLHTILFLSFRNFTPTLFVTYFSYAILLVFFKVHIQKR